jgi:glutathione reductase (NADPH)
MVSSTGTDEKEGVATAASTDNTNMEYDYDLVVIGGGSGGVRASRIAAGYGARVALLEPRFTHGIPPDYSAIGGTCVNVGCVPKKLMVFASRYPNEISEMAGYGWTGATPGSFHWETFMSYKNKEISRLNNVYQNVILKNAGVHIIEATGSLTSQHSVSLKHTATGETTVVTAKNILIAVGGWPYKPSNIPGIHHAITSNEIFYLKEQPKYMIIVGGGFIALEFACIMSGLGTHVTLMYRGDLFLKGFDMDMRLLLKEEMERNHPNINLLFNTDPVEIIKKEDNDDDDNSSSLLIVTDNNGNKVECDTIMYATGRKGKIDGLNLDHPNVGVQTIGSFISVDEYSRTNIPNIYAVGDITNRIALTPVALMEGHRLADTLFGNTDRKVDHEFVASTVFTTPEIGTVGYTEEDAVTKFGNVDIYRNRFRAMKHSFPQSEVYSLFKLIVETKTQRVIGCHIATDGAGEMIQGVAIAIKMGATKEDFDNTIGVHPTSAEELVTMRTPSYYYRDGKKLEKLH